MKRRTLAMACLLNATHASITNWLSGGTVTSNNYGALEFTGGTGDLKNLIDGRSDTYVTIKSSDVQTGDYI